MRAGEEEEPSFRPPGFGAAGLLLPLLTALAAFPVAGWPLALIWLLAMTALTLTQDYLRLAPNSAARLGPVFVWLRICGYSLAAFYMVALHTGAAQTFGVTLIGLVLFQIMARDYANPRRLLINLIPPVLAVALAQLGAAVGLIVGHHPLMLVTLIASPLAVFGLLRTVYQDLTGKRRRLDAAVLRAEAAAEAKSDFLANMSHEIRTPLTGIIGFADLLNRIPDLSPTAATHVRRIASSGQTLVAVVNDILDFSKLEAGHVELDPRPFEVRPFFDDTLAMVTPLASAKGLAMGLEFEEHLPEVLSADGPRLRQVMLNLLGNAVKFTAQGSVGVRVSYDAAQNRLCVRVTDTGCGVAKDKLERLFQRFSQADSSVTRTHGGTGLGLSICKALVELMGGRIDVESVVEAGSSFSFWVHAAPSALLAAEPRANLDLDLAGRSPQILVVDDLDLNRELVRTLLETSGYSVEEAASGAEALKAAQRRPFDLILMDLQMPQMDGFTAAREIRKATSPNRRTPIVALSANVLPEHALAVTEAGMNGHIGKPINVAELLSVVATWVEMEAADPSTTVGVDGPDAPVGRLADPGADQAI